MPRGEARAVMSQNAGQDLHIPPVLQRQRCEGVPDAVGHPDAQALVLQLDVLLSATRNTIPRPQLTELSI